MRKAVFGIKQIMIIALVAVILFIMTLLFLSLLDSGSTSGVSFGDRLSEVFE